MSISGMTATEVPSAAPPPSYLRGEHGGTGPNAPADHRLGDAALLDAPADLILLSAPYLPRNKQKAEAHKSVDAIVNNCPRPHEGLTPRKVLHDPFGFCT